MLKLSISMTYYLRRLLRQHEAELTPVIFPGAGLVAHTEADLAAVLESLYPEESECVSIQERLATLVLLHQQGAPQREQIAAQIFWLLGLKYAPKSTQPSVRSA